jgi:hypothetical protein
MIDEFEGVSSNVGSRIGGSADWRIAHWIAGGVDVSVDANEISNGFNVDKLTTTQYGIHARLFEPLLSRKGDHPLSLWALLGAGGYSTKTKSPGVSDTSETNPGGKAGIGADFMISKKVSLGLGADFNFVLVDDHPVTWLKYNAFRARATYHQAPAGPTAVSAATFHPIVSFHGGWASYSMSDINDLIADNNKAANATTGPQLDKIDNALGFGAAVGYESDKGSSVVVGYDRLSAVSEASSAAGSVKLSIPANAFRLTGEFAFPRASNLKPLLGGSLGYLMEAGTFSATGQPDERVTGPGALGELFGGARYQLSRRGFSVGGSVGYRYAKIDEIRSDGSAGENADGSNLSIDFSGVFVRLDLRMALAK